MSKNEDYFIKIPHNLIRIPAFGEMLKSNPTLMPVWSTLVSWGYYDNVPFFNNKNHLQSKYWADIVNGGKLPSTIGIDELVKITGFDKRSIRRTIDTLQRICLIEVQKNLNGDDLYVVGFAVKRSKDKIIFPTFLDSMGRRAMTFAGSWACQELFESLPENTTFLRPIYDIKHGANNVLALGFDAAMDTELRSVARPKFEHIQDFMDDQWELSKGGLPHQFNLYFMDMIDKEQNISCDIEEFWDRCQKEFHSAVDIHKKGIESFILSDPHKWK